MLVNVCFFSDPENEDAVQQNDFSVTIELDENSTVTVLEEAVLSSTEATRNTRANRGLLAGDSSSNEHHENLTATADDRAVPEELPNTNRARANRAKRRNLARMWTVCHGQDPSMTLPFLGPDLPHPIDILSPFQYFKKIFGDDLMETVVHETNLYSAEKNINKPLNVTEKEMEQWIGLLCFFSIVRLPNTKMHWCRSLYPLCDIAGDIMSRDRFEAIKSSFHLVDNAILDGSGNDKFCKVRPMIDYLRNKFQTLPKIQNVCVDEQLVPFKGRLSVKQYIPNKPKKWGFKLFVFADDKGMMFDFYPYGGKIESVDIRSVPDLKASANSVLHLAQTIPSGVNHLLFFDNWFTSLALMDHLASRGIFCCGTVRPPRLQGLSNDMKCQKTITKKQRGAIESARIENENSEAVYVKWFDNRVVNLLSTFAKVDPVTTVRRFDSKAKKLVDVSCPDIVKQYNKSMGGVDLADQLISLYRCPIRSMKYYMRLVFHMIDMVVVNAWLLYRRDAASLNMLKKDILSLAEFKLLLSFDLMMAGKVCGTKRGRPSLSEEPRKPPKKGCHRPSIAIRKDGVGHLPRIGEKRQRCRRENCSGKTNVECKKCVVSLFLNNKSNCFALFHE